GSFLGEPLIPRVLSSGPESSPASSSAAGASFPPLRLWSSSPFDHDRQPLAGLHAIAPDGPNGAPLPSTDLASKPDCARSELISCTVVTSICLGHDTPGINGRLDLARWIQHATRAAGAACTGKKLEWGQDSGVSAFAAERQF